jgi:hypothetical protein
MRNDPASTRTGIVIGGAYLPQRNARYADPIELPESKRRRFWRAALCLAMFALMGVLLAGCSEAAKPAPKQPTIVQVDEHWVDLHRYGPDEHGIACYVSNAGSALACVKVK